MLFTTIKFKLLSENSLAVLQLFAALRFRYHVDMTEIPLYIMSLLLTDCTSVSHYESSKFANKIKKDFIII